MYIISVRIFCTDIVNWMTFASLIIAAFTLAFTFFGIAPKFEESPISGPGDLFYLLFFDAPEITEVSEGFSIEDSTWSHILQVFGWFSFIVVLILTTLVLLNLLIAMMTTTYTNITESSDLEFKMTRARFIKYYSKESYWLPMPLFVWGWLSVYLSEWCPCLTDEVEESDGSRSCCRRRSAPCLSRRSSSALEGRRNIYIYIDRRKERRERQRGGS